jgi:hypothetical protein
VLVPRWLRSKERMQVQETIRAAIERGQPLPTEVLESFNTEVKKVSTPLNDIRSGLITLAVGGGIAGFGYFVSMEETDAFYPLMGIAIIPSLIGAVLILFGLIGLLNKSK